VEKYMLITDLLNKAFHSLPEREAYTEARKHILAAMSCLQEVAKKEIKRKFIAETPLEKWQLNLKTGQLQPPNAIKALDNMIKQEQDNLEALQQTSSPNVSKETLLD
jgi:hypothetical protein